MNIDLLCKHMATLGPVGYMPGSGTIASILTIFVLKLIRPVLPITALFITLFACVCLYVISRAKKYFIKKDPRQIVVDEVVGCMIAQFGLISWPSFVSALLLFRFFDIFKRPFIWRAEFLPGSAGILCDDIIAGFLSFLLIRIYSVFL